MQYMAIINHDYINHAQRILINAYNNTIITELVFLSLCGHFYRSLQCLLSYLGINRLDNLQKFKNL